MINDGVTIMIIAVILLFAFIATVMALSNRYNLNNIKNKTVGDGQHGTARWARRGEIKRPTNTYLLNQTYGEKMRKPDQQNKVL